MALFASAVELELHLGESFTTAEAARATQLLTMASGLVQSYTRQTITQVVDDSITLRGTWAGELILPERPVTAVSSVTLDGTALVETDNWWRSGASLWRVADGNWGGPGVAVAVTYTHGYATIPDEIRLVALSVASRAFTNASGVRQESIDGYSVTYADTSAGVPGGLLLSTDEQAVLNRYRVRSVSVPV